ncbi:MAG: CPBP family intramembrane metalloprotease [Lachnospiraceae bacterium]|nr:CPBP family intramembrane metalloprotease [Lachnospiraceae bacterium]
MEENKKLVQVRSIFGAILLFLSVFLLQIVAAFIGMLICIGMRIEVDPQNKTYIIFLSMLSALLSLGWCAYWYRRFRCHSEDFSYRKAFGGARIPALIGLGMGGCVCISIFLTLLQQIFPSWFESYQDTMSNLTQSSTVLAMLYALLIGPLSEEVIFRGAIMNQLSGGFSFWLTNFIQAIFFGIYHMNLVQGLYAFALGLVLGLVWLMTETIAATIAVHILFNSTNVILQQIFPEDKPISVLVISIIFLLSVLFFSAGLWYTIYDCHIKNRNDVEPLG